MDKARRNTHREAVAQAEVTFVAVHPAVAYKIAGIGAIQQSIARIGCEVVERAGDDGIGNCDAAAV